MYGTPFRVFSCVALGGKHNWKINGTRASVCFDDTGCNFSYNFSEAALGGIRSGRVYRGILEAFRGTTPPSLLRIGIGLMSARGYMAGGW